MIGEDFVEGGVHPRFGTRNRVLPLTRGHYLEVVSVLDHPASDKVAFGQLVRARSEAGGGWLAWVLAVGDIAPVEKRLGRVAVAGSRHLPDGFELRWKQLGVSDLHTDPQLPFLIEWEIDHSHHPSRGATGNVALLAVEIAGDPGRIADWLGEPPVEALEEIGVAVGRTARSTRHRGGPPVHPVGCGPDLTAAGIGPRISAAMSVRAPSVAGVTKTSSLRERNPYRCAECGWEATKWVGRCGECQAWGTVEERRRRRLASGVPRRRRSRRPPGRSPTSTSRPRAPSAPASASWTGCSGAAWSQARHCCWPVSPGWASRRCCWTVAARWALPGRRTLYVTGEESTAQVRLRAERTGAVHAELYLAAETDLSAVLTHVEQVRPSLLVVDSVQAIGSPAVDGVPGGVTQVREVAATLVQVAKRRGVPVLMVGHVTKDGLVAGPRLLEHMVDVVLPFEGDRTGRLRFLRAVKNRYGPVDEVGCFDLSAGGIVEVTDPTGLFVSRHGEPVSGTCVTVTMEGRRPLLAEVQALVAPSAQSTPRRATSGIDPGRSAMVLAVLQRRLRQRLASADVYLATVGGARVAEPAADLAIAIASGVGECRHRGVHRPGGAGRGRAGRRGAAGRCAAAAAGRGRPARLPARAGAGRLRRETGASPIQGLQVIPVDDVRSALQVVGLAEGGTAATVAPNHGRPRVPHLSVVQKSQPSTL